MVSYIDEQVIRLLSDTLFNPALVPTLLDRYNNALNSASSKNDEAIKKLNSQIREKSKGINNILKSLERVDSEELTSHLVQLESEKKNYSLNLRFWKKTVLFPKLMPLSSKTCLYKQKLYLKAVNFQTKSVLLIYL